MYKRQGAYGEHVATGLWLYGAYGRQDNDTVGSARLAGTSNPDADYYYIKAGLKRKHFAIGSTTLYGEYGRKNDAMTAQMFDAGITGTDMDHYGVGVVQNIDAAAMQMWLSWRHYEGDITCNDNRVDANCGGFNLRNGSNDLDEFDLIKFGALINF